MKRVFAVFRKEVRDGLRDRRAVLSGLLVGPLLGPALLMALLTYTLDKRIGESMEPIDIAVVGGEAAPNLVAMLHQFMIDADETSYQSHEALRTAVAQKESLVGLVIDEGFAEALQTGEPARVWVVADRSKSLSRVPLARLHSAVDRYGRMIGNMRLAHKGMDPTIAEPIAVLDDDVSTPSTRAGLMLGIMTYFLLLATFIGGTQIAVDSTAGERERGSLEPLLTLAVSRQTLVAGKALATIAFMAVSMGVSIATLSFATRLLPLEELGMAVNLDAAACLRMFVVVLPFAVLATGVLMMVASYAKTSKEAQMYVGFAMLAPTLPVAVVSMAPVPVTLPLMLIPSMSQHLLALSIIKAEPTDPLLAAVSALSTVALGVLLLYATVRRYRREELFL